MDKTTFAGFSITLIAGAIIGGVIALLYAPQSGKETRDMMMKKAKATGQAAIDGAEDVKKLATDTADKVVKAAKDSSGAVVHAIKS